MPKAIDYTNQIFGQLTAIGYTGRYYTTMGGNKKRLWSFRCTCGSINDFQMEKVVRGDNTNCGCLKSIRTPIQVVQHQVYNDSYRDGDLTEEEFYKLSQLPCYYCNAPPSNQRKHRHCRDIVFTYSGLDRIDNKYAHDLNNVFSCCWICNNMKKKMGLIEFLMHIERIYHHRIKDYRNNK